MLLLSAVLTIAGGVTSSAIVSGHGLLVIIGGSATGLFFVGQVLVTFVLKSGEERELLLTRRIRIMELERAFAEAEAIAGRIQQEIQDGNLDRAYEWIEFRRRLR